MTLKETAEPNNQTTDIKIARLEMILDISRALNSTLDLAELLQSITDVATQLTDTEAASILLLDKKTGELYFEAATGEKQAEIDRIVVPLENSIAGWVVRNTEPLVVDNIRTDKRHYQEIDKALEFETRSILGVPLQFKQETIGVLEVLNKQENAPFTGDDVYILNTLASQAAVAIENARLFEQSDQLADMVHELRSPITSISGFSQLMLIRSDLSPEDMKKGLENIYREANRLAQMINDFLDLSRLETGRTRLEEEPVSLSLLTQEVIDMFYPQAEEKEIDLSLQIQDDIPDIIGDSNRLKQVIVNLVDNAAKYTLPGGKINVTLSANDLRLQVSVRDTGQGIAPKDLESIFDKFYRVEATENEVRGSGLGLCIAKRIIEAHQGDIWVESEPGVGSAFTFSLPLN